MTTDKPKDDAGAPVCSKALLADLKDQLRHLQGRYDTARQNAKAYASEARQIRLSGALAILRREIRDAKKAANAAGQGRAAYPAPACSAIRRCEDCAEMPDDGTCDKCGDSILTTKDAFVTNIKGQTQEDAT